MSLEWHGDAHKKRLIKAAKKGIDKTLKEAATHARANHPGWESRSGKAEQSIKVLQAAEVDSKKVVSGLWGSTGIYYMRFLEHEHGSALRTAGDDVYKGLKRNIKEALK